MSKTLKNILFGLVALLVMAGIIIGSIALAQNVDFRIKRPEEQQTEEQPEDKANGGLEIENTDSSMNEDKGISLVNMTIPREAFAAYGIAAIAESAQTLTATITPDDDSLTAEDKYVDFTAAWDNPSSEWATGKDVSDYVTVTQATDGALTATVSCLQAFGEKIVVTCTSRLTPTSKATADLHYKQKVDYYSVDATWNGTKTTLSSKETSKSWTIKPDLTAVSNDIKFNATMHKTSVYTRALSDPTNFSIKIESTPAFVSAMQPIVNGSESEKHSKSGTYGKEITMSDHFYDLTWMTSTMKCNTATKRNNLITALVNFAAKSQPFYTVSLSLTSGTFNSVFSFPLYIDTSVIATQKIAANVQMDKTELEF